MITKKCLFLYNSKANALKQKKKKKQHFYVYNNSDSSTEDFF